MSLVFADMDEFNRSIDDYIRNNLTVEVEYDLDVG